MILNINNKNIIYVPYIKRCVFWFESNQWIPKKRFAPREIWSISALDRA